VLFRCSGFWNITIDNQTSKNYLYYLDNSTTTNTYIKNYSINGNIITFGDGVNYFTSTSRLNIMYIPSYSLFEVESSNLFSNNQYLNAWYLKDLGVSDAYNEGYDQGETDGYDSGLSDGYEEGYDEGIIDGYEIGYDDGTDYGISAAPIQNIFTSVFSSIASIFNINIFGNITFGTIILAPIAVALLWFILGIISGVGGKKQ
jgi:hypothetical protein